MGKLTQKVINKQIGGSKFRTPERCCGGSSYIQGVIQRGIPVENDSTNLLCYQWDYTMTDPSDELESIALDDAASTTITVNLNIALSSSEYAIYAAIIAGFIANSVSFIGISVQKTDLGGGLFSILIILYSLPYVNLVGQAAGSASLFTETSCDADYIQDNNSANILDSLGSPFIST